MGILKTCKKHGSLSEDQIYVYKNGHTRCKLCDKINHEKTVSKNPEAYKKKCKEAAKKYYQINKERVNASSKAYWAKNREKLIMKKREQRKKQREEREALKDKS